MEIGDYINVRIEIDGGNILYRIEGVQQCGDCKEMDALICRMVDGSSKLFVIGKIVLECGKNIERDIQNGTTKLYNMEEGDKIVALLSKDYKGIIEL